MPSSDGWHLNANGSMTYWHRVDGALKPLVTALADSPAPNPHWPVDWTYLPQSQLWCRRALREQRWAAKARSA